MTAATHPEHHTITERVLCMAFELSEKTWKLGFTIGHRQKPRERAIAVRELVRLLQEIAQAKKRFGLPEAAYNAPVTPPGKGGIAMIPHHVYYQLAILGLLGFCIMLHFIWPSRGVVASQPPAKPVPPTGKRKRSKEPKPFAALTRRPHCAACDHDGNSATPPSPKRPAPMLPTTRRPRVLDTSMHFCPHEGKRASVDLIVHVIACLAKGLGIRATLYDSSPALQRSLLRPH